GPRGRARAERRMPWLHSCAVHAGGEPSTGRRAGTEKGPRGAPFRDRCTDAQRFFALVLLRAAVFLAGRRFAVLFLAEDFLAVRRFAALFFVLLLLAIAMRCPLSFPRRSVFRTPCVSGAAVPVRSCPPTRHTVHRGGGRSSDIRCGRDTRYRSAWPPSMSLPS